MKKFMICLLICCVGTMVFAGPRDRRGRGGHRPAPRPVPRYRPAPPPPPPPRYVYHRHDRNDGLYIANSILGIVDKSLRILNGPETPVIVTQPPVVVTQPVVQQPVVVTQPVVQQPATQVIQVGGTEYVIYTDANGQRRAIPVNQ